MLYRGAKKEKAITLKGVATKLLKKGSQLSCNNSLNYRQSVLITVRLSANTFVKQ